MIPEINTGDYTYNLPDSRIARYPLEERDSSKLLVYRDGNVSQSLFRHVGDFLPNGSMLIFNNTKVIRARLMFRKETGALIEVFCLEPLVPSDVQTAFASTEPTVWKCIVGNSKKWKAGSLSRLVDTQAGSTTLVIDRCASEGNTSEIRFSWDNKNISFAEIIESAGVTPIPPYLNRESEEVDTVRYQTVYSSQKGSVAAPTAGLHFTPEIIEKLHSDGHFIQELTLHVGAGTFKPVQTSDVAGHLMHTEHFIVEYDAVKNMMNHNGPYVTVGTTSVRTAESLYWLGVRLLEGMTIEEGVSQWDPYSLPGDYSVRNAFQKLLDYMDDHNITHFQSQTAIMIVPGYKFRVSDLLITNFHQPHSTLLLLIGAYIGMDWHIVYNYALDNDFRFLSYGDSSLLFRNNKR